MPHLPLSLYLRRRSLFFGLLRGMSTKYLSRNNLHLSKFRGNYVDVQGFAAHEGSKTDISRPNGILKVRIYQVLS